jgi:hypothetical protein
MNSPSWVKPQIEKAVFAASMSCGCGCSGGGGAGGGQGPSPIGR